MKVCLTVSVYVTEISINHARLTSVTAVCYVPELALLLLFILLNITITIISIFKEKYV